MKTFLKLPDELLGKLEAHLLPPGAVREEAAFLYASVARSDSAVTFEVIDATKMAPADFRSQRRDYLELTDDARARLIKQAHHLGASLIEMHSHPGPYPAAFSDFDLMGFEETVPHMWWRLKKRPYVAIVVAQSGFDALVWVEDPQIPQPLDGIVAGNRLLRPTNISWKSRK